MKLVQRHNRKEVLSSGSVLLCLHPLVLMPGELYGESAFSLRPNKFFRVQPAIPLPLVTLSSSSMWGQSGVALIGHHQHVHSTMHGSPPTPRMRTETPEHPNQDAKHIQRPHTMVLHKQNQVSSTMTRDKCSPCNGVNFWVVIFGVFLPFGSIYLFQIDKYICLIFRNAFA